MRTIREIATHRNLNEVKARALDTILNELGITAPQGVWVGLSYGDREVVRRRYVKVKAASADSVVWQHASWPTHELKLKGLKYHSSILLQIFISVTPAGQRVPLGSIKARLPFKPGAKVIANTSITVSVRPAL